MELLSTICIEQAASCRRNPEVYIGLLVKRGSQRDFLYKLYIQCLQAKKISSLEVQEEKIKRYYWEYAIREANGTLANENLKKLAKAFYILDYLLNC